MKMQKLQFILAITSLFLISFNAMSACAPQVQTKLTAAPYASLNAILTPAKINSFTTKLNAVANVATYNALRTEANATAALIADGRVVVTLPDGTVVVDTSKGAANTYQNFQDKVINENHNTRVAILDAQLYDCGVGLETKTSTSTGSEEVYVAKRLGAYLNSAGTVRLSHK
ncbi:hypothetical protein ABF87_07000 [Nitrosomonas sp. JL21]|uniref:hypothetical protein n=1 Tax=Nitrosomonas sp. JL21 TaxID=153949 RepID=UPI001369B77B|nr:hypothetical protein [Nitrosomonas sp. JL21]MBL8498249.1 hypothetical protein [Nitrosomonas sp.]MCC7091020.1 hypothetical protein [Nitrosomonas sp.]MXS77719.1 hypothetical protein [Nitrosomonas sp. JL21]